MKQNSVKTLNVKIKGLAIYQIIGGIVGDIYTILAIFEANLSSKLLLLIYIVSIILFSFSIYCGIRLLQERKSGLILSLINQALQILNFTVFGFGFLFASGIGFFIGVDCTNSFVLNFNFTLSEFECTINGDKELMQIGINILAVYLCYFIQTLYDEIDKKGIHKPF